MSFGTFTCTCTAPQEMVIGTCRLQGRQPLSWDRSPLSFGQISLNLVFQGKSWDKGTSSLALPRMVHLQWPAAPDMIWYIYSHLYCSSRDGVGTCCLQGRQPLPWGRSPVSFKQIGQSLFFSCWLLTWFGTFTRTCTAHWGMVVGTCHLQGRQPLPWGRFPVSFEQISQPSFFSWWLLMWFGTFTRTCTAPRGMVVGTCHLQGRQPPSIGKVHCELQADQLGCSFSGEELRQGSFQPCPSQDGATSMASGSRCDLAQLLTPVLLIKGWWQGLAIFRGGSPHHWAGHLWVSSRSTNLHFSAGGFWCDLVHLLYSHLYCSSRDGGRDLPSSGEAAPTMGKVPCEFQADWPNFIFQPVAPDMIWHIYSHLYCFLRDGGRDLPSLG